MDKISTAIMTIGLIVMGSTVAWFTGLKLMAAFAAGNILPVLFAGGAIAVGFGAILNALTCNSCKPKVEEKKDG